MKIFTGKEANEFIGKFNLGVPYYETAANAEAATKRLDNFSFPLVLRLISDDASRALVVQTEDEFNKTLNEFKGKKESRILLQEFIDGVNFRLGLKKDLTFGHVIMLGQKEEDVSFRICPINDKEAFDMIKDLRTGRIILAKENNFDVDRLKKVLVRLSKMPHKKKDIREIDVELAINEETVKAVDATITFD